MFIYRDIFGKKQQFLQSTVCDSMVCKIGAAGYGFCWYEQNDYCRSFFCKNPVCISMNLKNMVQIYTKQ